MNYYSGYDNCSLPCNAQPPRFDLFYEPIPENSMQPANQAFQQQPPSYFQPYGEQSPWHVQQEMPHLYWDQCVEPKQEEIHSEQPWQPQFCDQWQQGIPAYELQGLTNQVAELVAVVNKLTGRAEEEKEAATNEASVMVAATPEFQVIKCPTTSVTVYANPSLTDSHSVLNSVSDNSNSLMSGDCMNASVDSESVCELYVGDESTEPHSEIDCIVDLNSDLKVEPAELEVQIDFRKSKEYLKKMREAADHVLVLQYYEMDFDADVCEPENDFNVFDHMHDVPVEVVDFSPCFDHSNIIKLAFSIDRVHIPVSSVFYDCTDLNALLDDESGAHDDRYVVFDDMKVDMTDFENACTDLGLELELEFAGFLNSLELSNEKLTGCTCLGGGCEICEEISSAICSASNYFAGAKEEIIMFKLDGNDPDDVASDQRTQVYSELSIPIEFSKVQYEFNALDLFKVEPIEPAPDYVPVMLAHSHILDSACSIENIDMPYAVSELCTGFDIIPVDDSFTIGVHLAADLIDASEVIFEEPVQVDFKFELPICLGEVQTSFDNLMHEKPLPDILVVIPDCSEKLDEICVVEHIDIFDDFYDVCIGLDNNFEDSFMDCVEFTMDFVVITREEPTQVLFNLEILVVLSEFPLQFSSFDCLCIDPLEPVVNPAVVIDSKVLRAPFEIERIHTPTVCTDNICPTFDALVLHENDLNFTFNKAEMFDDSLMNIDFDFAVAANMTNIATHLKKAADTKEVEMDAREGINDAQRAWNLHNQQQRNEEIWLLQLKALHGELMLLKLRAGKELMHILADNGENPISSFFSLPLNSSYRSFIVVYIALSSIINSRVENMLFFIKIEKINFDLWPI
ncbi:uncharacterized protein LOC128196250 [Vigna angularis]|nr:uncharacterized protein LOC128196250 [Vigna angularis]